MTSLALGAWLSACGGEGARSDPGSSGAGPTDPPAMASLEGVVRLADGAELPEWPENPMTPPYPRPAPPDHCAPPQQSDRQPVRRVEGDRLAGVLVALSEFETEPLRAPVTHELVIRDCRLTPSLVVATVGDSLRLTNDTEYPYLPNLGGGIMRGLMRGRSQDLELGQGGMRTVECGFAAACGRAVVVTMNHPLHSSTDEAGRFRIANVPPGEELKINAWHPLFEETSQTLTLAPGETRQLELVLRPGPPVAPPSAPPHDPDDPTIPR